MGVVPLSKKNRCDLGRHFKYIVSGGRSNEEGAWWKGLRQAAVVQGGREGHGYARG